MSQIFHPTILLSLALMTVIVMMVLPVPAFLLDLGLAVSFALAILVFTVTLFIERPLEFSAFPSVLLTSLMLRLSLNVSSTKLIVGQGHTGTGAAGDVIEGFATFVMSGSLFLGLVVFGVLLIVNFIVITKGAARMAEVGARFALDGMPGKQLAIDSDMSAGAIDHDEASRRRELELAETTFFGSLDGASKFVKGDAISGLLITILNLIMGVLIGVFSHQLPIGQAFENYAILTVGDGLVNQIPAVIMSIAAALLLARGGATETTDTAIFSQLGRYPKALGTVAVLMLVFAVVPGLPFLPFLLGAVLLGGVAFLIGKGQGAVTEQSDQSVVDTAMAEEQPSIGDILDQEEIHVEFASDLVPMVLDDATGLDARIRNIRMHVAREFGLLLPDIRLTDDASLPPGTYTIQILGVEQARDRIHPDRQLVLLPQDSSAILTGEDVKEPVFGAPARWLVDTAADAAALSGATIVAPAEVLATHLLETLKKNFDRLMNSRSLNRMIEELCSVSDPDRAAANRRMIDEHIPEKVPVDLLLSVLRLLLAERVSIRNFLLILETIAEARHAATGPEDVCERVRQKLGFQILSNIRSKDGSVPLVQLAPEWEDQFRNESGGERSQNDIALDPGTFSKLTEGLSQCFNRASEAGHFPALVTSVQRRRYLQTVMRAKGLTNPVLSFDELGTEAHPALVGVVAA